MKIIFFGYGYCAEFLTELIPKDWEKIGTHTNLPYDFEYKDFKKVTRYKFNEFIEQKNDLIKNSTHILISIPPNDMGDLVFLKMKDVIIKEKNLKWLGYLSTTGVYGDHNGDWVNESSELMTKNLRSKNRILSEKQFLSLYHNKNVPIHIFRLPGIYGPNRSMINRLKNNKVKIIKKKNQFFSRVHVEDIASCLFKSIRNPTPGEIYNITDDYPSSATEVTVYTCKLLGIPIPKEIDLKSEEVSEMTRSFYLENKKVSNKKVKKFLNWKPKYKDYKVGLKSILKYYNALSN